MGECAILGLSHEQGEGIIKGEAKDVSGRRKGKKVGKVHPETSFKPEEVPANRLEDREGTELILKEQAETQGPE